MDRLVDLGLPEAQRAEAAATVARLAEAVGPARLTASMAGEVDWVHARGIAGRLIAEGLVREEHRRDAILVGVRHLAEARDDEQADGSDADDGGDGRIANVTRRRGVAGG